MLPAPVSDEAGVIEEAPPLEGELDDVDPVVDFEQAAATIPMIAAETTNSFERLFTPLLLLLGPPWRGEGRPTSVLSLFLPRPYGRHAVNW